MELDNIQSCSLLTWVNNLGIITEADKTQMIDKIQTTKKNILFIIADYLKHLTPADCYDISYRLVQSWMTKQCHKLPVSQPINNKLNYTINLTNQDPDQKQLNSPYNNSKNTTSKAAALLKRLNFSQKQSEREEILDKRETNNINNILNHNNNKNLLFDNSIQDHKKQKTSLSKTIVKSGIVLLNQVFTKKHNNSIKYVFNLLKELNELSKMQFRVNKNQQQQNNNRHLRSISAIPSQNPTDKNKNDGLNLDLSEINMVCATFRQRFSNLASPNSTGFEFHDSHLPFNQDHIAMEYSPSSVYTNLIQDHDESSLESSIFNKSYKQPFEEGGVGISQMNPFTSVMQNSQCKKNQGEEELNLITCEQQEINNEQAKTFHTDPRLNEMQNFYNGGIGVNTQKQSKEQLPVKKQHLSCGQILAEMKHKANMQQKQHEGISDDIEEIQRLSVKPEQKETIINHSITKTNQVVRNDKQDIQQLSRFSQYGCLKQERFRQSEVLWGESTEFVQAAEQTEDQNDKENIDVKWKAKVANSNINSQNQYQCQNRRVELGNKFTNNCNTIEKSNLLQNKQESTGVFQRLYQDKQNRRQQLSMFEEERIKKETRACTFQPKVSPNSARIIAASKATSDFVYEGNHLYFQRSRPLSVNEKQGILLENQGIDKKNNQIGVDIGKRLVEVDRNKGEYQMRLNDQLRQSTSSPHLINLGEFN